MKVQELWSFSALCWLFTNSQSVWEKSLLTWCARRYASWEKHACALSEDQVVKLISCLVCFMLSCFDSSHAIHVVFILPQRSCCQTVLRTYWESASFLVCILKNVFIRVIIKNTSRRNMLSFYSFISRQLSQTCIFFSISWCTKIAGCL